MMAESRGQGTPPKSGQAGTPKSRSGRRVWRSPCGDAAGVEDSAMLAALGVGDGDGGGDGGGDDTT